MPSRILCVVDARQQADKSFFERKVLQSLSREFFDECKFLFLLPRGAEKKFFEARDEFLIVDDRLTRNHFFSAVLERAKDINHVLMIENEIFPSKDFFSQLKALKPKQILLPRKALVLRERSYVFFDQKKFSVQSPWKSEHFLCAGFSPEILADWRSEESQSIETFDDLGESFFQMCFEKNENLVFNDESAVFAHSQCLSYQRALGLARNMAYFSKIPAALPTCTLSAIEKLEKYKISCEPIPVLANAEQRELIQAAAAVDPRWQRIDSVVPIIYHSQKKSTYEQEVYSRLCNEMKDSKYVVLLHQLRRGGAEKEAILHLKAYCQLYPKHKVSLVLTLPVEPDLEWQLPDSVQIVEFAKIAAQLPDSTILPYLLFRVLDFIRADIVHTKCSLLGWEVFERYGQQLSLSTKLWSSLYCVDYGTDGFAGSYAFQHLFKSSPYLSSLFLDNQFFLDQLRELVPLKNSSKLFYPVESSQKEWVPPKKIIPLRILWCARLSFQKDLKTLLGAAWLFPEIEFHVYGEISESEKDISSLSKLENIKLWGAFDGVEEIDIQLYHAFLYTSLWDGLPNILLEIGSLGMPIISPRLSGIAEILEPGNSFLYDDLSGLSQILSNWQKLSRSAVAKAKILRKNIIQKHNWNQFIEKCRDIYAE